MKTDNDVQGQEKAKSRGQRKAKITKNILGCNSKIIHRNKGTLLQTFINLCLYYANKFNLIISQHIFLTDKRKAVLVLFFPKKNYNYTNNCAIAHQLTFIILATV